MKLNDIFSLLIEAGKTQGFFLALILLSKKSENKKANIILSISASFYPAWRVTKISVRITLDYE